MFYIEHRIRTTRFYLVRNLRTSQIYCKILIAALKQSYSRLRWSQNNTKEVLNAFFSGGILSQLEWVTKRQHPGKRYFEDLEKRQHPGRREGGEDEQFWDVQKRQHPGKREDEMHSFMEFQKRQHPGKRYTEGRIPDTPVTLLSELSKRQHPGKRYLVLHSKRQHPGKRFLEDEDGEGDWTEEGEEDMSETYPGKRFWDNQSPELSTSSPCDVLDSDSCSKTSLLLDFLENINKSHAEEKRQHPGKRFAPEEDFEEEE